MTSHSEKFFTLIKMLVVIETDGFYCRKGISSIALCTSSEAGYLHRDSPKKGTYTADLWVFSGCAEYQLGFWPLGFEKSAFNLFSSQRKFPFLFLPQEIWRRANFAQWSIVCHSLACRVFTKVNEQRLSFYVTASNFSRLRKQSEQNFIHIIVLSVLSFCQAPKSS